MSDRRRALLQRRDGDWFRVENKQNSDGKAADVYIFDDIGFFGVSAQTLVDQIRNLDVPQINLHLNSPGGEVWDGIAIRNALMDHPAKVTTIVDGVAASSASFIAMAGDEVVMNRNSELMIHDAQGLAMGDAATMVDLAQRLDQVSDNIASIYAARTGESVTAWRDRMRAETWYTAQEAVDAGLADRVADPPPEADPAALKNRFDFSIFNYAGRSKAPDPVISQQCPAASASGETKQKEQDMSDLMDSLRKRLGITDQDADEATVLKALDEVLNEQTDEPQGTSGLNNASQLKELAKASGAVIVDKGVWDAAQASIQEGVDAARKLRAQERDTLLEKAVGDGRIPPANKEYWANLYDRDPKGTAQVIGSLRKNLVPVDTLGYTAGDDDLDDMGEFASLFPKER